MQSSFRFAETIEAQSWRDALSDGQSREAASDSLGRGRGKAREAVRAHVTERRRERMARVVREGTAKSPAGIAESLRVASSRAEHAVQLRANSTMALMCGFATVCSHLVVGVVVC